MASTEIESTAAPAINYEPWKSLDGHRFDAYHAEYFRADSVATAEITDLAVLAGSAHWEVRSLELITDLVARNTQRYTSLQLPPFGLKKGRPDSVVCATRPCCCTDGGR